MTFFVAFFLPVTISLGSWQLNRAEDKDQLSDELVRYDESSLPFDQILASRDPASQVGQKAEICMMFTGESWLLDNRTYEGRSGYDVYWPGQRCNTTDPYLVRLGWVQARQTRAQLPDLPEVPDGVVLMTGEIRPYPPDPFLVGPPEQMTEAIWRFQSLGSPPDARFGPERDFLMQLIQPEVLALPDNWDPVSVSPARHLAYAAQWYGLAVVLMVGYVVWGRHRSHLFAKRSEYVRKTG